MKKVLLIAVCCLLFCGCGNKENNINNTEKDNNNTVKDNLDDMSSEDILEKLMEVNNWVTTIWNNGICDIDHYLSNGTNSLGQNMDVDSVLKTLNENYKKKEEYSKFINSLKDSEYTIIKENFIKAMEQADIIITEINNTKPEPNTKPQYQDNIELFNQYQTNLYNYITKLYYEQ